MEGLQGASEFTQVFQRFFSPSERSAYGKYKRKDNGDANQGEVHVKLKVHSESNKRNDQSDAHGDPGSVIDNDQILLHRTRVWDWLVKCSTKWIKSNKKRPLKAAFLNFSA